MLHSATFFYGCFLSFSEIKFLDTHMCYVYTLFILLVEQIKVKRATKQMFKWTNGEPYKNMRRIMK